MYQKDKCYLDEYTRFASVQRASKYNPRILYIN
jgi:hypothetical protein